MLLPESVMNTVMFGQVSRYVSIPQNVEVSDITRERECYWKYAILISVLASQWPDHWMEIH